MVVKYFYDVPKSFWNIKQAKQDLKRHPACLTGSDYNYIFYEIAHWYQFEFEINISVEYEE